MAYTGRQNALVQSYLAIAGRFGAWPKAQDADGAGYVGPELNLAKDSGWSCGNCAFYSAANGACGIVKGQVSPNGLCRLAVVDQALIQKPKGR